MENKEVENKPDQERGLYGKYLVLRNEDPKGKHKDCHYFVLDLVHDKFAGPALEAYAEACRGEYPKLAMDLMMMLALDDSATEREEER